jgi:hypothetical protein
MASAKRRRQGSSDSPESLVSPYEDINTRQLHITGETFPTLALGICDNCHWCYSCINARGIVKVCPVCGRDVSQIPMDIDEVCFIEEDERRGITLNFDRRLPLR